MAYPTNALAQVLEDVDRRAMSVKEYATRYRTQMAAGDVLATVIVDLFIRLKSDKAAFVTAASTSGLGVYAQAQKNDQNLNIGNEFTAMNAAIDGVTTWIETNFPKDANGYLLRETWSASGPVDRAFSSANTAGLRTVLATLIATIA